MCRALEAYTFLSELKRHDAVVLRFVTAVRWMTAASLLHRGHQRQRQIDAVDVPMVMVMMGGRSGRRQHGIAAAAAVQMVQVMMMMGNGRHHSGWASTAAAGVDDRTTEATSTDRQPCGDVAVDVDFVGFLCEVFLGHMAQGLLIARPLCLSVNNSM